MDWAELNPDLLHHIAKNLRDISDFIRFRAVYRQWRSAVHPCDLPQQLPCFINWKQKSSTSYDIQFCRLFSEKVHTVPINNVFLDPKTPCLFDSLNGLLLIHSQHPSKSWFLLNPLTGFQVQLPVTRDMSYFLLPIYFGPIYGPKPTSVKKCIDVAFRRSTFPDSKFAREDKLCLWLYDYVKWTRIGEVPCSNCEKVSYYHGRLYALSQKTGHIRVIDFTTGNTVLVIRPPSLSVQLTYLVEAGGDLLGVYRDIRLENLTYPKTEYRFEVYCLEEVDTNPFWKKLKCLGGRVLFFDGYYSWLCLKASDLEGCQGNCIYFKTPVYEFNYFEGNTIVRYDLEKDTTEVTVFSDHLRRRWFVLSLC
ncbi:F-box protein skip23 [Rhynchospora pubera]|uniref:F-box protein skip23 n=1 Tax=Rhynchospora pubera TaxID=906938 RepID=A0AAV8GUA7_9POAL|nr:F-box protein skip23 [Rhynchospora pubera]